MIVYGGMPGRFPLTSMIGLPFLNPTAGAGARTLWALYNEFPEFQQEQKEVKVLTLHTNVMNDLQLNTSVRTMDDLKGLKIVGESDTIISAIRKLGGSPVELPSINFYEALQRGTIDGYLGGWPALKNFHWDEFIDYHTVGSFSVIDIGLVMNINTYNSLPPDLQQIVDDVYARSSDLGGITADYVLTFIKDYYADRGDEIYVLPPDELAKWKDTVVGLNQEWIDAVTDLGYPGQAIYDRAVELTQAYAKIPIVVEPWWGEEIREFGPRQMD